MADLVTTNVYGTYTLSVRNVGLGPQRSESSVGVELLFDGELVYSVTRRVAPSYGHYDFRKFAIDLGDIVAKRDLPSFLRTDLFAFGIWERKRGGVQCRIYVVREKELEPPKGLEGFLGFAGNCSFEELFQFATDLADEASKVERQNAAILYPNPLLDP